MQKLPDAQGHFGEFGGRYVSETLMPALLELEEAYDRIRRDPSFRKELRALLAEYVGRPTPLTTPVGSPTSSAARRST
jgi:tryptophan synthase beta chain